MLESFIAQRQYREEFPRWETRHVHIVHMWYRYPPDSGNEIERKTKDFPTWKGGGVGPRLQRVDPRQREAPVKTKEKDKSGSGD